MMRALFFTALLLVSACAPGSKEFSGAKPDTPTARGASFAAAHCARCHAVGQGNKSPDRAAPPLHVIASRYDLENLAGNFAAGIKVAHRGSRMPAWQFTSDQVDDLIAYLESLKTT